MKRQLAFALALLFIVGAALWGVNYRLDHPPLTEADKEFRALVAGADSMRATQASCQSATCTINILKEYESLNSAQTRELIEHLQLVAGRADDSLNGYNFGIGEKPAISLNLEFKRHGKTLARFVLTQNPSSSGIRQESSKNLIKLNPRFNKRLNRTLDDYLPQRIRP